MKKTELKCQNCGWKWQTASKLRMPTCPSCNRRVKRPGA